jgi:ATP-dependent helicase/nuclease subunit B
MGLTIIAGRAGIGKSLRVARRIGDLARDGKPAMLLVPEQYTLEAERALMAALSVPGLLHIQVMSPSRFVEDVFSRVGGARLTAIDERGKAMALRRVVESCLPRLRVFGQVARSPGFGGPDGRADRRIASGGRSAGHGVFRR